MTTVRLKRPVGCCHLWCVRIGAAMLVMALSMTVFLTRSLSAQSLVADLSDNLIQITTGFTGSEVVLFGAMEGSGSVAVVVTGPRVPMVVRRKDRIAGIWVNRGRMLFVDVPGYYAVATTEPLDEIGPNVILNRHEIGLQNLHLTPSARANRSQVMEFRQSLIRNMQRIGLYREGRPNVRYVGERLFRTNIFFPANVPTGSYTVGVFLLKNGNVVSAQTVPLSIRKAGLSSNVFGFAHDHPLLYGFAAIAAAVLIGWAAGAVFRD